MAELIGKVQILDCENRIHYGILFINFSKNSRRSIRSNARSTYDGIHWGKLSYAGNWNGHVGFGGLSSGIGYHFDRSADVFTQVIEKNYVIILP